MPTRKCIFTGLDAKQRTQIVSKTYNEDLSHNWANTVPCNIDYTAFKDSKLPNEDELEAMRLFFKLELVKVEMAAYEGKLAEIQLRLKTPFDEYIKEKQIKKAYAENSLLEEVKPQLQEILAERKRNLFE